MGMAPQLCVNDQGRKETQEGILEKKKEPGKTLPILLFFFFKSIRRYAHSLNRSLEYLVHMFRIYEKGKRTSQKLITIPNNNNSQKGGLSAKKKKNGELSVNLWRLNVLHTLRGLKSKRDVKLKKEMANAPTCKGRLNKSSHRKRQ